LISIAMGNARTGWCSLWLSPRYRIEDHRVTFTRSPVAWVMLAVCVVGLVLLGVYLSADHDTHGQDGFSTLMWGFACAGGGGFSAGMATWFPGRVVITPGAIEWGKQRHARADVASIKVLAIESRGANNHGRYKTFYLQVALTSRKGLSMKLAQTQWSVAETARVLDVVVGAARTVFQSQVP
jgi:hypothetical protein